MGRSKRLRRKKEARSIARERMEILFSLAEKEALAGNADRAKRYVGLFRRIGMRYNVPVPRRYKIATCRNCNSFLISGKNSRTRLEKHRIRVECLECGGVRRFPYGMERQKVERRGSANGDRGRDGRGQGRGYGRSRRGGGEERGGFKNV